LFNAVIIEWVVGKFLKVVVKFILQKGNVMFYFREKKQYGTISN